MARMTLEQIKASRPEADRWNVDTMTEKDIARQMREGREALFVPEVMPRGD